MIFGEIMAMIDGIGRVRNLLLNEHEKQIVKTLVLKFDESSLFDPKNTVKYALISNKGNLEKYHHYQKYLDKHADVITKALSKTSNKQLVEKLSGFRTVSKEFIRLDEQFEASDEEINIYRGKELPRLRETIDRYRWLMSQCILTLIQTVNIEISTVNLGNFKAIIELAKYAFDDLSTHLT
jgi:hypothetical protein